MKSNKEIALLLNPLQRIAAASEHTMLMTQEMHGIITIDLKKAAVDTSKELKRHTAILGEIRDILKAQGKGKAEKIKGGGPKIPGMGGFATAAFAMVGIAAALLISAGLLSIMPVPNVGQFITAIALTGLFMLIIPPFIKLVEAIEKSGMGGKTNNIADFSAKAALKLVGIAVLAMVGMTVGLVLSSWVLQLMMPITLQQFVSALAIAVIFIPISWAIGKVLNSLVKNKISMNKKGMKTLAMVPLAMAAMALGIVAAAHILQMLPSTFQAPPLMWTFKVGLALWMFSFTFSILAKAVKGMGSKGLLMVGLAIPILAMGLVAASWITMMLPSDFKSPPVDWTFKVGLALWMFAFTFAILAKATRRIGPKGLLMVGLAIPILAAGLVAAAWITMMLPDEYKQPPLEWSFKVGLALFMFAATFAVLARSTRGLGAKGLLMAGIAIPIVALGLVAAAWITMLLPDEFKAPPVDWSLKVGLALFVFSFGFIAIALATKIIGVPGMLQGLLGVVAVSIGILAVAWLFSVLPDTFIAPPMDWSINAAISLIMFAIPMAIIGGLAMLLTPAGLLLGAVGMILLAGVIWVVAWIFSKLPDVNVGALDKLSRGLMSPVHAIIDALARFKNEIGIDQMIPLAGGLLAIAGAWLALTAAVAGQAIGGVFASMGNMASSALDGITSFFGGDEAETPFTILDGLAKRSGAIIKLGKPLGNIAKAMSTAGLMPFIAAIQAVKKLSHLNLTSPASQLERIRNAFQDIGTYAAYLKTAFAPLHTLMAKTALMIKLADHLKIVAEAYGQFAQSTHKTNIPAVWASVAMFNSLARLAGIANAMVMVQDAVASIASHAEQFIHALSPISKLAESANQVILKGSALAVASIARSFFSIMSTADSIGVGDVFLTSELFEQFKQLAILQDPIKSIANSFVKIAKQAKGVATAIAPLDVFFDTKNTSSLRDAQRSLDKMQRSYGSFANHTNKVNIKAVNATTRMFTALTDLAQADGDNVMKTLADELFAATKELGAVVVRLEESVKLQTEASEGTGNVIIDTIDYFKNMVTANTEQASANADAADSKTQQVKVTNFSGVTSALSAIEERLGLPMTFTEEDDAV